MNDNNAICNIHIVNHHLLAIFKSQIVIFPSN